MRHRLLALDIDGTLLDPAGELRPAVRDAVGRAQEAGLRVVLCTGRRFRTARPVARALGVEGPLVLHNGALVKDAASGATRDAVFLPEALVPEILDAVHPHGPPLVYLDAWPGSDFVTEPRTPRSRHQAEYLAQHSEHARFVDDLAGEERAGILMMSVMTDAETLVALRAEALRRIGPRVRTHSLENKGYGGRILEFLALETGKWTGLARVAAGLGIAPEEIAAVGDDLNDLELVREAGLGIAMGNAVEELRAVADLVVASNARDGAVEAIEAVLGER
jgi:hypothetical protein